MVVVSLLVTGCAGWPYVDNRPTTTIEMSDVPKNVRAAYAERKGDRPCREILRHGLPGSDMYEFYPETVDEGEFSSMYIDSEGEFRGGTL